MKKTSTMAVSAANEKLTKTCKMTKKTVLTIFTMAIMCCMCSMTAFASGAVDSSSFISTAGTVLRSVVILIGGGVGVWGVVNLLEGSGHEAADGWSWFDSAGHYPRSGTYQHDAECCLIVCYGNNLLYFLLRMTCGQFVRRSFL